MAKIYANLVKNNIDGWTIDKVPERWRAEVEALLNS